MKFANMDHLDAWLSGKLKERMRRDADAMALDGWTQAEIEAAMAGLAADTERCRRDMLAEIARVVAEPDVPSSKLQ